MNQALRKSCRTQLTKLINRANELLIDGQFDVKEAIVLISRLKSANESLNKVNKDVSTEIPDEQIEAECDKIVEYEDKAVAAIAGLEFEVSRAKTADAPNLDEAASMTSATGDMSEHPQPVTASQIKRAVRLPKLELIKFNGDYHLWPAFWEQYDTAIHTNSELDDSTKFTYLKSVLTGNAALTIQGLTSSCSSYNDAIELLREQYGNNERIIDTYIQQLLALTPVKNKTDIISLRKLYNTVSKITRSLQTLGMSAENYGIMVKSIVMKALPFSLKTEFHKRQVTSDYDDNESVANGARGSSHKEISYEGQISQLLSFIKLEIDSIEQAKVLEGETKGTDKHFQRKRDTCTAAGLLTSVKEQCLFCKSYDHGAASCNSKVTLEQKKEILRSKKCCYRCTKPNHNSRFCRVKISCSKCKAKHATSMCDPNYKKQNQNNESTLSASSTAVSVPENPSTNLLAGGQLSNVYLQTACAEIVTTSGVPMVLRMVLDGGSQLTFIKECLSRQLNLPVIGTHKIAIMGFGKTEKSPARLCKIVSVTLKSRYSNDLVTVNAVEVPEICFDSLCTPSLENPAIYEFSINFPMADACNEKIFPGISMLIGADYYWKIVSSNTHAITNNLMGIETKFGWTIHGVGSSNSDDCIFAAGINVANVLHLQCEIIEDQLDLRDFWSLEAIGIDSANVIEKSQTHTFLNDNVTFENNRYRVSLPWIDSNVSIDSNFNGAFNRLKTLTRKLSDSEKLREYDSAVREYINNNCAELSPEVTSENRTYFMPHRAVYRQEKDTSKIRIVFDASAHAPGLPSLNDVLLQGENLVPHLFQVLMNFRIGKIALIADIEKAFLQIEINERDRDAHSFIWYEEPIANTSSLPKIVKYRMKRVTFGVNCSPFLLAVTLKKHLECQPANLKSTSDILATSFYVDDLVMAVSNVERAKQIYYESKEILAKASMNLRKWMSNNVELRELMNRDNRSSMNGTKVLGVLWYPNDDELSIDLNPVLDAVNQNRITKRGVLQAVSKIFDPLGFLSPFIVRAKLLLQEIWKAKLEWDSPLPPNLANDWLKWCSELQNLKDYSIPRCALKNEKYDVSLHIFSDASPVAYGTVAYLRTVNENSEIDCRFLMAKHRVAPINLQGEKTLTLPKLELTAAVCAARLQHFILTNIRINISCCFLWTDSKITLHWIRGKATKWKPYICNRVMEIQKLSIGVWRHCPGTENPADLLTRGLKSNALMRSEVWQNGPEWLKGSDSHWPEDDLTIETETLSVLIVQKNQVQATEPIFDIDKYSNLEKIFRLTAYALRFIYNLTKKGESRTGSLSTKELNEAENYWVKITQQQYFPNELTHLTKGENLESSSSIITLNPFLHDGIMRLGGRLHEASLPFNTRHPIVLPKKSSLTDKIIRLTHIYTKHGGVNLTVSKIRDRFWIVHCRQRVKSVISKCLECKRLRAKSANEPFAPLPKSRVSAAAPFKITGLDFAGPLYIFEENKGRQKAYIMLFTCAVIRAVHLELVPDLTTETCINALRRFISKRGIPDTIYSDNAKTFKRTALELNELSRIICHEQFQNFVTNKRINWKFIVERASWWGGFWERMVKTVKEAIKLSLAKRSLNSDELRTALAEVEATINSRPLTYIDDDPDNLLILSPSHFLLGSNECGFAIDSSHPEIKRNDILKKWRERNHLMKGFWKKWSSDYLQQLRLFHKQNPIKSKNVKVGDIALLHDQHLPRLLWKLVRITRVFHGRDGRIRSCEVTTSNRTLLRRPIQLLFPLEITAAGEDVEN